MRKTLSVNVIFLVLGFFRVAGNFPYRWQKAANGVLEVTVSSIAALWSGLVLLFVAGTCLFSITNLKSSAHRGTEKVLDSILRTYWYVMLTFLYAYFAFNSRSLARILRKMVTAGVNLRRRIVDVSDVPIAICAVCIAFGVFWSLLKVVHDDTQRVFSRVVDSIADLSITLFLSILYFLVKVVSLEMEETVGSLRRKESRPAEVPWASPPPAEPKTMTTTATNFEAAASPLAKPLRSPAQRLFQLDEVMRQIVGFTGPPVALLLLNNISASTVFLYNAITDRDIYYALYIVVPLSRMVHVILVPDPLLRKRDCCKRLIRQLIVCGDYRFTLKEVEQVEQVVETGVPFSVCGFFTLGRQTLLTVWSFVTTYLIITLQFRASEGPQGPTLGNSSLSDLLENEQGNIEA